MQTIQWTNEVIIACGVIVLACILLGYFIASLLQGRQLKLLAMQLEQGQATASAQQEALKEKLRAAEGRSHELQVIEGRLQAQLRADGAFLERTIAELQEYKKSAVGLGTKIEQQAQQHHDALTRLESALADGRALRDRVADLDGRLAAAQKLCDALRDERGRLKDEVAGEAGRAELAEASEREVREQLTVARKSLADQVQAFAALQDRYQPLSTEHAELKTSLQKREEHFQEQVTDLRERLSALQGLADELRLEGSRLKDELATSTRHFWSWVTGSGVLKEEMLERDAGNEQAEFVILRGFADEGDGAPELVHRDVAFVDHLHEHFLDPCVISNASYMPPSRPGFSIEMKPESIAGNLFVAR